MVGICACIELLKQEFEKGEMKELVRVFLERASNSPKWMLYSDYCLDDRDKPNDVLTFVLIPFISEGKYQEMENMISKTQPVDIKHTRNISDLFMEYIKTQAILSFSFILNERQQLFGSDEEEQKKNVEKFFTYLNTTFIHWRDNTHDTSLKAYYNDCIDKLKKQSREIFMKKKVKDQIDVLLIALLASFYTAAILKQLPNIELFGWFPDRDKTNEVCEGLVVPFFNAMQYVFLDERQYLFCASKPDSHVVPFYDNENRIADIICGTLADYNIKDNLISKDKFDEVLQGLLADNQFVKVYRFSISEDKVHMGIIEIKAKE